MDINDMLNNNNLIRVVVIAIISIAAVIITLSDHTIPNEVVAIFSSVTAYYFGVHVKTTDESGE